MIIVKMTDKHVLIKKDSILSKSSDKNVLLLFENKWKNDGTSFNGCQMTSVRLSISDLVI